MIRKPINHIANLLTLGLDLIHRIDFVLVQFPISGNFSMLVFHVSCLLGQLKFCFYTSDNSPQTPHP